MTNAARSLKSAFVALMLMVMPLSGSFAGELPAATGEPILTVSGKISNTNHGEEAIFDIEALKALPRTVVETSTIWTKGTNTFVGVSLKDFIAATGATGSNLHMIALNDYAVDVPASDAIEGGPILAYEIDGKRMSVRDKGPLWVIYPFDANPDYRTEIIYTRSIWQLTRIDVQE